MIYSSELYFAITYIFLFFKIYFSESLSLVNPFFKDMSGKTYKYIQLYIYKSSIVLFTNRCVILKKMNDIWKTIKEISREYIYEISFPSFNEEVVAMRDALLAIVLIASK